MRRKTLFPYWCSELLEEVRNKHVNASEKSLEDLELARASEEADGVSPPAPAWLTVA